MNDLELQQLLAQQAQYQGQRQTAQPQGRMVGRTFVAPSALEHIAAGLRQYGGIKGDQQVASEINKLRTKREGMDADAMAKFASALRGEPARDIQPLTPNDDDGNPMQVVRKEAVAPDAMAGYGALMGAHNPQLRQAGMQGMVTNQQEAAKRAQADALTTKYGQILSSGITPQQAIAMGVPAEFVKSYMEAPNLGRAKVARTAEIEGAGGTKQIVQLDDFGNIVGQGMAGYVAPVQVNQGNQITFAKPTAGQSLPVGMSPAEKDASSRGWANVGISQQRFAFDKDQALTKASAKPENVTEGERKAATLLQRMQGSEAQLEEALKLDKNAAKPGLISSGLRSLGSEMTANAVTPENRQKVEAAQLDILDAALTLGTGAAYTKEQLEGYRKSYFPQIGDKPETIKDKQARLNNILDAARIAAGRAAKQVTAQPPGLPSIDAIEAEIQRRKGGK